MNRSRWIFLGILCLFVLGSWLLLSSKLLSQAQRQRLPDYPRIGVKIGAEDFTILETKKGKESSLGLGAVPELPKNYGMLFGGRGSIGIWMKGMNYPIDIIWIDENWEVIHIAHDVKPSSYPTVFTNPKGTNAWYVIEIGAGEVRRLGLDMGDKIKRN